MSKIIIIQLKRNFFYLIFLIENIYNILKFKLSRIPNLYSFFAFLHAMFENYSLQPLLKT
jgi:hypothetical protein